MFEFYRIGYESLKLNWTSARWPYLGAELIACAVEAQYECTGRMTRWDDVTVPILTRQ